MPGPPRPARHSGSCGPTARRTLDRSGVGGTRVGRLLHPGSASGALLPQLAEKRSGWSKRPVHVVCADELGPVTPRTFPLEYCRGPDKVWFYGALRVRDGQAITLTTRSRNTEGYLQRLEAIAAADPNGKVRIITDNLARGCFLTR